MVAFLRGIGFWFVIFNELLVESDGEFDTVIGKEWELEFWSLVKWILGLKKSCEFELRKWSDDETGEKK